ncbi:hypothetical protein KUTeg_019606, partial [Tegillarca granosa]
MFCFLEILCLTLLLVFCEADSENKRLLASDPNFIMEELNAMKAEISSLKSTVAQLQNGGNGAVYTRWGKKSCPGSSSQVYTDPLWGQYNDSIYMYSARLYGTEYEGVEFASRLHNEDVPCSVCRSHAASTALMIPGRNKCYSGWNMEYNGYLAADYYQHQSPSEYVCLDSTPDVIYGGHTDQNGAVLFSEIPKFLFENIHVLAE